MRKLASFVVLLSISSVAAAGISARVCLSDGNTPLEPADANTPFVYRDIMVGTKLTIIVSSDAPGRWSGGLYIEGDDRDYGVLSGRAAYNAKTRDWEGSHLPAAGLTARVENVEDMLSSGFELGSHNSAVPGDWFIIDYTATKVGVCRVALYESPPLGQRPVNPYEPSPPDAGLPPVLLAELVFNQVPTRDFDQDATVGLGDFAIFASYWGATTCTGQDWCQGADLDADGNVDAADLALFADYWLKKTQ